MNTAAKASALRMGLQLMVYTLVESGVHALSEPVLLLITLQTVTTVPKVTQRRIKTTTALPPRLPTMVTMATMVTMVTVNPVAVLPRLLTLRIKRSATMATMVNLPAFRWFELRGSLILVVGTAHIVFNII
jgi:hypothetical protein